MKSILTALLALGLTVLAGCTGAQRDAVLDGSLLLATKDPVVEAVKQYIGDDQTVIAAIGPSFQYLAGRWSTYSEMDQAAAVVPLILQRRALWNKAKAEAAKIRDGLLEFEQRTEKPMPLLVAEFLTTGEGFVLAMDKAIAEGDNNARVQFLTANLGKFALIAAGVPQIAALLPSAKREPDPPRMMVPA